MTFYELEKECKKRKRNLIILILLIMLFLLISGFFLFYILNSLTKPSFILKKHQTSVQKTKKTEIKQIKKHSVKINQKLLPLIDLKIDFKEKIQKSVKQDKNQTRNQKIIIQTQQIPSFETCINLSKKYLEKKDFKKALKWAKLANIQNKRNPLSWILSAKALYGEGKKEEAIKLLKIYDSYYNNKEIKKLIKEIDEK